MKIEYILVLKSKNQAKTKSIKPNVQNILKKCYDNVGTDTFEINYEQSNYVINYECTCRTDNNGNSSVIYYLTFSYGTSRNEITASVLDYIHECFISKINKGETKFHVTISYDERALYFCAKAYPYFGEFESKLRCLILKLLTQTFGILWAQKTLTEEQIKKLKEKMHGANFERIASEALYEMDFSTLESYLFAKTREVSAEFIIDNKLNPDSLKELDIDKISNILDLARPKSNWERYFAHKIEIEQLEEKLAIIREERNKVAHIKHYRKKDFDEDKEILSGFNVKLDEAICSIEISNLTLKEGIDTIIKFGLFLGALSSISSVVKQAIEASHAIGDSFTTSLADSSIINSTAIKSAQANIPKVNSSVIKTAQASMSQINLSAIKSAQASMSQINLSAIKAAQANMPKINSTAIKSAQANMPKVNSSAIKAAQANVSKSNLQELQRLRTTVLNNERNRND